MIQGGFDAPTAGYCVWIDEFGVLTSVMMVAFAVALYRLWPISEQINAIRVKGAGVG